MLMSDSTMNLPELQVFQPNHPPTQTTTTPVPPPTRVSHAANFVTVQRHSDDFSELDSDLSTPDGSGSLSTLLPAKTVAHCLREAECLQRKKQARRHNTDVRKKPPSIKFYISC